MPNTEGSLPKPFGAVGPTSAPSSWHKLTSVYQTEAGLAHSKSSSAFGPPSEKTPANLVRNCSAVRIRDSIQRFYWFSEKASRNCRHVKMTQDRFRQRESLSKQGFLNEIH